MLFFHFQARASQQPLVNSGKSTVTSSVNLFLAAKQLANNNKDQNSWNIFAQHARAVADAMKKIVVSLRLVFLSSLLTFFFFVFLNNTLIKVKIKNDEKFVIIECVTIGFSQIFVNLVIIFVCPHCK